MTSWKRITLVVFVLIGGTITFGYWSFNQFNNIFNDLEITNTANILSSSPSFKKEPELASTLPETPKTITKSTDLELFFNFPKKGDKVYTGCTYPISWQSSTIINSLGVVLVDAGTRELAGPIASGLTKENIIETNSQNLNWKVGVVWPGEYYIKVLKINGFDTEIRSKIFTINKMPEGINTDEKEKICKEFSEVF